MYNQRQAGGTMALLIGIDVGGTHADGALLDGDQVLAKKKVQVDQDNLSTSVFTLLQALVPENKSDLARIHLSSTLCTNAIINNNLDQVGMLIQAGPGLNPSFLNCGEHICFLDGAIDHRGHVIRSPDDKMVEQAVARFREAGIASVGIVTKFSHRNNIHEQTLHDRLAECFTHISTGHRISGLPNFPRRVYSTWLNAALKSRFMAFKESMEKGLEQLQLDCPCHILKADGGTIPFAAAAEFPCETVHSGPSASVMGCLALQKNISDAILLDIGGTTTDIALLAGGVPLLEPYGITIHERPTLIRALNTRSVGLGGDSAVVYHNKDFVIGPNKKGPPMAFGGTRPTPTDAMVVLGTLHAGDKAKAEQAMQQLIADRPAEETATSLLASFAAQIKKAVDDMLDDVFSRPVYTVAALLKRKRLKPQQVITVGGPAEALQDILSASFGLPCIVPDHFEVANAIGSARTRPTLQATLYADTADCTLAIPETGVREKISSSFSMKDAEEKLRQVIAVQAEAFGLEKIAEIDFVERQEMNTVRGFHTVGKIISLKAQIRPGLAQL